MNKAIFLDRDGVMNEDISCLNNENKIKILEGVSGALNILNESGFLIFITTNQPIIARGILKEEQVEKINKKIIELVGGKITKVYFCPHHPNANLEQYRKVCECRKPAPGMLKNAEKEFDIDMKNSFMIGDMPSDIAAGKNAGCRTILIKSRNNEKIIESGKNFEIIKPDYKFNNLLEAARFVVK